MTDHLSYNLFKNYDLLSAVSALCKQRLKVVVKIKLEINSGLNGIQTMIPVITVQSFTNWAIKPSELATFWVRNIPVDGEEYKWIYHIWNCDAW